MVYLSVLIVSRETIKTGHLIKSRFYAVIKKIILNLFHTIVSRIVFD